MKPDRPSRDGWLVLLPLIAFVLASGAMQHYLIDDSFISFRYARNLVNGMGLVFNAGERVEGYTNFLWTLAVAGGIALGARPETTAIALGVVSALASIVATYRLAAALSGSRWALLAPSMLACSAPFVFWTYSGLETVAVSAFATLGALGMVRAAEPRAALAGALALAIACLVRPDAALLLAVSLVALPRLAGEQWRERVLAVVVVMSAVFGPYALWKLWYYGDLVPNTFHAKVGGSIDQALRGLRHAGHFLVFAAAAGFLPAAAVGLHGGDARRTYLAALVVTQLAYVVAVGGDSFLFHRFLVPVLPVLAILAALGFETVYEALHTRGGAPARWVCGTAVVLVLLTNAGYAHLGHYRTTIRDKAGLNVRFQRIAVWLKESSRPDDLVAVIAAGIIPYYSELPTLDMLGLTDAHIARRSIESMGAGMAGHEKGDGRYVLERRPRYVLIHPITTGFPVTKEYIAPKSRNYVSTRELWALSEFHRDYELRSVKLENFYFNFFERRTVGSDAEAVP